MRPGDHHAADTSMGGARNLKLGVNEAIKGQGTGCKFFWCVS